MGGRAGALLNQIKNNSLKKKEEKKMFNNNCA